MKYLPREVAFGKMKAMVAGAAILRAEYSGRAVDGAPPVRAKRSSPNYAAVKKQSD
jgi:hypothetical protein